MADEAEKKRLFEEELVKQNAIQKQIEDDKIAKELSD